MDLLKIRDTYNQTGNSNIGPTADNTSRIALMKKVQVKTSYYNSEKGKGERSRLWGLNELANKSGSNGDSGIRTKFVGIFPRMSFY